MVYSSIDNKLCEVVMEEKKFKLRDGKELFYRVWETDSPIATVHINHGMAEHSLRYNEFAEYLNREGFSVYCQDHRGHGHSIGSDPKGWFAAKNGWHIICEDSFELDQIIEKEHPDIPHMLFGHSMGSFAARCLASEHSDCYSAAVFCGTGPDQGVLGKIGIALSRFKSKLFGSKHVDKLMEALAFGSYNKRFKEDGEFGWLSSDRTECRRYIEDPWCGFTCTSSFYGDLVVGITEANDPAEIAKIRKNLPILIISGAQDPVGGYGKGVKDVYNLYKNAGIEDVRLKLYEEGRHEILNDVMRYDVMKCISAFYKESIDE